MLDSSSITPQNKNENLSKTVFGNLRSAIGQVYWVANQTRPDVCYDVCQLSVGLVNATNNNIVHANKRVKRLKTNEFSLCLAL